MGYRSLVEGNVRKAFRMVKDLASDVVLNRKPVGDFDFATSSVKKTRAETATAKAIMMSMLKGSAEHNSPRRVVLFSKTEVGDLTIYDSFTWDGVVWKLGPVLSDDGYVVTAEMYREA
jgi:hypothetical protein